MLPRFCVEGQAKAGAVPLGQVDVAVLDDGLRQPVEDIEPERRNARAVGDPSGQVLSRAAELEGDVVLKMQQNTHHG